MRPSALPTLHKFIDNGYQLRQELAFALSRVEMYAKKSNVNPPSRAKLQALLDAASTELTRIGNLPASIVASATDTALSLGTDTSEQIVVTATELDGGTSNVAATSSYTSSDPTKGTVSATGLVTAVAIGSFTVTAQYQNKVSNALAFTVSA